MENVRNAEGRIQESWHVQRYTRCDPVRFTVPQSLSVPGGRYFVPIIVLRFAASFEFSLQVVKLVVPTGVVVQMVPSL